MVCILVKSNKAVWQALHLVVDRVDGQKALT